MTPYYRLKRPLLKKFIRLIDWCGSHVFGRPKPRNGEWLHLSPSRVLVVRLDHLGDLVLALPALQAIKQRWPQAHLTLVAPRSARELLAAQPEIDEFLTFDAPWFHQTSPWRACLEAVALIGQLRRRRFDVAIDLRGDLRHIILLWLAGIPIRIGYGVTGGEFLLTESVPYDRAAHEVQRNLNLLTPFLEKGAWPLQKGPGPFLQVEVTAKERVIARLRELGITGGRSKEVLSEVEGRPLIAIHPAAGTQAKSWPTSHWQRLIQLIRERHPAAKILLVGGPEWRALGQQLAGPGVLDWIGETSLAELAALLPLASAVITPDSGPAHLAAAVGAPLVAIFSGTNEAAQWAPQGDHVRLLRHPVPCSPCELRVCPFPDHPCMEAILPETVFQALDF